MTSHIPTLLLREWMQHKRGWLITAFAPPLLFLALLPFGQVSGLPTDQVDVLALMVLLVAAVAGYVISLVVSLFQLPGLARRDVQDRSIEFWLSLPGRPSESVAATALAHGWLAPLGGAAVGALFGLPIAVMVTSMNAEAGASAAVQWGEVISAAVPVLVRGVIGTVPLVLWLAPVVFTLMAASAWLKRLGVPVVLVGTAVVVSVLGKFYRITWPGEQLSALWVRITQSLIHDASSLMQSLRGDEGGLWGWAMRDLGLTLADLASVQFAGWMAIAAVGFALVVLKRSRGG